QGGVGRSVSATTAILKISSAPSLTALSAATRSAQTDRLYVEFSTLQPVNTLPSDEIKAAPTLNLEYGACANSLPLTPRSITFSSDILESMAVSVTTVPR